MNETHDTPNNCAECEHYDGTCDLCPKKWESWILMEHRPPEWCPLKEDEIDEKTTDSHN